MSRTVGQVRMRSSLVVALALLGAASGAGAAAADTASPSPSQDGQQVTGRTAAAAGLQPIEDPLPPPPLSASTVRVEPLTDGLTNPTNSAVAPGDPDGLYVSDQVGPL
jgi:glucose/arabinose dehydrogenase